jgi:Tfp pilus assembly protein PilV
LASRVLLTIGMAKTVHDDAGVSLIEVLVATMVFVVGAAGLVPVLFGSIAAVRVARDVSMTSRLAQQKMHELLASGGDLASSPSTSLTSDAPGFVEQLDELGRTVSADGVYVRRWLVEPVGLARDAARVVVAVDAASATGRRTTIGTIRRGGVR